MKWIFFVAEQLSAAYGLYCVWGMWRGVHGGDPIDHEWDALGVMFGVVVGIFFAFPSFFLGFKTWWWHVPLFICLGRVAIIFAFNT